MGEDSFGSMNTMRPGADDAPSSHRLKAGDTILGRYTVVAELGQGGMGVVYKCLDTVGGVEVAVKCLPPELSHNTLEMEDIRDNYQLVCGLRHPGIVGLRTLEKNPQTGDYYLVMDLAEGVELRCWLRQNRDAPVSEKLRLLGEIASALDYAHERKIVHRDVKPGNVMVAPDGSAHVLDFGLAAQIRTSMSRVSMAYRGTSGTGPYMAPEQWRGRPQGAAADQYALGVMAYEMFAGHLPFESPDTAVLKQAVLDETPAPITGLPPRMMAAIRKAMAKDAKHRYASCAEFVAALAGAKPPHKDVGRRAVAVLCGLVALVGLVFAVNGYRNRQNESETSPQPVSADAQERVPPQTPPETTGSRSRVTAAQEAHEPVSAAAQERVPPAPLAEGAACSGATAAQERVPPAPLAEGAACSGATAAQERVPPATPPPSDTPVLFDDDLVKPDDAAAAARAAAALKELEEKEDGQARKKLTERQKARALEELEQEKATAREAAGAVFQYRRGADGEFARRFKSVDASLDALARLQDAEDLGEAKRLKNAVRDDADWIANNSAAREEIRGTEKEIAGLAAEIERTGAKDLGAVAFGRGVAVETEAKKRLVESDLTGAKTKFAEALGWYRSSIAVAKSAQCAAKVNTAKGLADKGEWQLCLDAAHEALAWVADDAAALDLKKTAEDHLRPSVRVSATLDGQPVSGATLMLDGTAYPLPKALPLTDGAGYSGMVTLTLDGRKYGGTFTVAKTDWKGERPVAVALKELRGEGSLVGEEREIEIADGVKMAFVWVAPGSFKMGSDDKGVDPDEKPVHQVTLAKGYWIGKYEVTQAEWRSVTGDKPSNFKGDLLPVEQVSWDDCQVFVGKINDRLKAKGEGLRVRLPTEAEWEFAAKGGTKSLGFKYGGGDDIDEIAWHSENSDRRTHKVGTKAANELGLHDMSGNVLEWCADWYGNYSSGAVTDPVGPGLGNERVSRGGCWDFAARKCRSSIRSGDWPDLRSDYLGLRLAAGQ